MAQQRQDRTGSVNRATKETDISVSVNVDGTGSSKIATGVAFSIICWSSYRAIR